MSTRRVDVVAVPREQLGSLGGESWSDVVQALGGAEHLINIPFGYTTQQDDRASWTPPVDQHGVKLAYLPLNQAWLREISGRAFLYLQNW